MFRFKGLEYQRMIVAGVSDGQQARSLLFVATIRARDSPDIFWHGTPSPFLAPLVAAGR